MFKRIIIIFLITFGIVCNVFSENQINYTLPDFPSGNYYDSWYELGWAEIDISNECIIKDWSIVYTWITDDYPEDASFYVLSPSLTFEIIASAQTNGTYTVTSSLFNGESVKGLWVFWIEDKEGNGGCRAVNVTMTIYSDSINNKEANMISFSIPDSPSHYEKNIPFMMPESERQALIDFYNSTDGVNWSNKANWLGENGTECSWYGIVCNKYKRTIAIRLEQNNLNGEIQESFSDLQDLVVLQS